MPGPTKLFYKESPNQVVVQRNGIEIARYRNAEELVEVHMKGLLAMDEKATAHIRRIYRDKPGPA